MDADTLTKAQASPLVFYPNAMGAIGRKPDHGNQLETIPSFVGEVYPKHRSNSNFEENNVEKIFTCCGSCLIFGNSI